MSNLHNIKYLTNDFLVYANSPPPLVSIHRTNEDFIIFATILKKFFHFGLERENGNVALDEDLSLTTQLL